MNNVSTIASLFNGECNLDTTSEDSILESVNANFDVVAADAWGTIPREGESPVRVSMPDHRAIVRSDGSVGYGFVSDGYRIMQHRELVQTLQPIVDAGKAKWRGGLNDDNGGKVSFLLKVGETRTTTDDGGDILVMGSNGHGGLGGVQLSCFKLRWVCTNGCWAGTIFRNFTLRHTLNLANRVDAVSHWFADLDVRMLQQQAEERRMLATHLEDEELAAYFLKCLAKLNKNMSTNGKEAALAELARVSRRESNRIGGMEGTVWAALNTFTEWVQHDRGRVQDRTSAILHGSSRAASTAAWSYAAKLAA